MPKICSKFFTINSEHVSVDIFYNQKKHFFAIGIPKDVTRLSRGHDDLSGFETENDLYREIRAVLDIYHDKIKKTKKVIAYSLGMTTETCMKKTGRGMWEGYKDWVPDTLKTRSDRFFGNTDGYGFSIDWDVLLEIRAKETTYHGINEDGSIGHVAHLGERLIIDWTQEREDAFREIANALVEMVKKISTVLGDTQKVIGMIDKKIKLLPDLS